MAGRVVELRAGAREPQVGDRLAWDGMGWVPEVNIARPHGVTHVHTDTIVRVVMGPWRSPDFVSGSAGWQIDADGSAEFNNVTVRGTIYAEAGEIAGWTLAAGHLYAGTGAARVGLKPGTYPFYAGAEAEASAPFRVNTGGEVWATNAHITGEITATTGAIGGWTITATEVKSGTDIVLDSSVPKIEIGASGYIRSNNYVSGFDGFYIDDDFAEFGNVQVRGSLHCAVFVKDLISAHAGTLLVTKSAGKLIQDYTVGSAMQVETPPGGGWLFDSGDIVRLKEEYASGVQETWVTVTRAIPTNEYGTVYESGDTGAEVVYHKGATAVDYGASGDGGVLQTADMTNGPYLAIFTHAGAPWTTITQHLRLGNLKGTGDFSSDAYGIFIGDYAGNKWMSYDPTNSLRIRGDAIIEGTVAATTFTNDIGALLFSKADGLLLLGPNCEINDGEWWSLRRQKATISGAFHQEAGRWRDARALVVERGTTNLVENPSFEVNVTDYWTTLNGTATRITTDWRFGGACNKLTADASANPYIYQANAVVNPAQGEKYTLSAWVKGVGATIGNNATVNIRENGGASGSATSTGTIVLTAQWQRVSVTRTIVEADRTALNIWVRIIAADTKYGYVDGVQLENLGFATSYCDGSLGHEYTWSGTAHNSSSTRVATGVTTPTAGSIEAAEGFVAMWLKVPLWTDPATQFMWSAGNVNQELDAYIDANGAIIYLINGATRCNSANGAVTVDVWHLAVFNWKASTDVSELYIDGLLVDTGTCGGATPTLHTNLGVGVSAVLGTGYSILGLLGEFATGKTMLSAAKVAAMYALQRPLVDAGAMDRPGMYILDGQFKMASSLTGNRIEMDAEELAGYNSAGVKQFYLRASDGVALAAGGKWLVDASGQRIRVGTSEENARTIRWIYDDANDDRVASVGACWESTYIVESKTNAHLWLRTYRVAGDAWADAAMTFVVTDYVDSKDASLDLYAALQVVWASKNLFLSAGVTPVASDFGTGKGIFAVQNANTNPSTNPTAGGILYADSGAGKWRGSSGTVTTFGPAEPHCPVCGRDFVLEWKNEEQGTQLQVCVWCLVEALKERGDAPFVMKQVGPARVPEVTRVVAAPAGRVVRPLGFSQTPRV